jgi:hypothetical protein
MRSLRTNSYLCFIYFIVSLVLLEPDMNAQEGKLGREPEIGKSIGVPATAEIGRCMVSSGQLDKCFRDTVNGIRYTVAFRRRGLCGNVVTYVHTDDPGFKSPDGLHVGDALAIEKIETVVAAPGFEIYGKKGKGWIPVVGFNGEVAVVREDGDDLKTELSLLTTMKEGFFRLRITGFTKR